MCWNASHQSPYTSSRKGLLFTVPSYWLFIYLSELRNPIFRAACLLSCLFQRCCRLPYIHLVSLGLDPSFLLKYCSRSYVTQACLAAGFMKPSTTFSILGECVFSVLFSRLWKAYHSFCYASVQTHKLLATTTMFWAEKWIVALCTHPDCICPHKISLQKWPR